MRVRALLDRWGDPVVALAFSVSTQLDLWEHEPATMRVAGGRGVFAALLLLVTLPLALRRRRPSAALLTASGARVLAETHVARIFSKLRLHDRAQTVVLAYEAGLIQPGGD